MPHIKEYNFEELHLLRGKNTFSKEFSISKEVKQKGADVGFIFPFRTDHHVLIFVLEGRVKAQLNLTTHILEKNDLILISGRMVTQSIEFLEDATAYLITFTPEYALQHIEKSRVLESFKLLSTTHSRKVTLNNEEFQAFLSLVTYLEAKTQYQTMKDFDAISIYTFNLVFYELNTLYDKYHPKISVALSRKEELAAKFVKLLGTHLKEERSVQFYAEMLHVTSGHLSKTLKSISGKSAHQLIDEAVILEAKILLSNRSLSIAQVAEMLNFSDQSFFGKFFKKHTKQAPSSYRHSLSQLY